MNTSTKTRFSSSTSGLSYELTTTHVDDFEQMGYTTYGIRAMDQQGDILLAFPDISTKRELVQKFVSMVGARDVAPIHIPDMLEDFLD